MKKLLEEKPILYGFGLMMLASAMFAIMSLLIRIVGQTVPPMEIAFFRNLFGLSVLLPWLLRTQSFPYPLILSSKFLIRALVGTSAMYSLFWAITQLPLGLVISLSFTAPLFITIGAALFLKEQVGPRRWLATASGFLGVLIILQPGQVPFTTPLMITLIAAFLMAVSALMVKTLVGRYSPYNVVTINLMLMSSFTLIPAIFVWESPNSQEWLYLVLLGFCGTIGQLSLTKALQLCDASAMMPMDFLRLPFAAALAWIFLNEPIQTTTWIGAMVIFGSTAYTTHRESKLKNRQDK